MRVFRTGIIEWGFFLPPEHAAFRAADNIKDLAPRTRVTVPLAGLTGELHFARVVLTDDGQTRTTEHLVLLAHHPRLADAAIRSLATLLRPQAPGVALSFIIEDREGWARITPDLVTPPEAAAVAIAKYNGSWDDSDPIMIDSTDHAFDVEVSFADETWTAAVTPRSTPTRSPPR